MDNNSWELFNGSPNNGNPNNGYSTSRGQNGHFNRNSWEIWELGQSSGYQMAQNSATLASLYSASGVCDPHLACLNLGKRHYYEDTTIVNERHVDEKRGRAVMGVPTCQVESCHVALVEVKEYHRRHKVCEMHSKAPRVIVLGAEQRFCQQCSRFHVISEFDDSKRSCRRRLAGHNERRRKGSHENGIIPKDPSQGHALSLLSSTNNSWLSSSSADLSTRGSAALYELIAENRAANLARQVVLDRDWFINQHGHSTDVDTNTISSQNHVYREPQCCGQYNGGTSGHVTLDLMQAQNSAFGLLSMRGKSRDEEEGCSDVMWRSLGSSHEM